MVTGILTPNTFGLKKGDLSKTSDRFMTKYQQYNFQPAVFL